MKALSLFSGCGGMDLGFHNAGIQAAAFCEINKQASSVLRRHWPDIPIFPDVREVTADALPERPDVIHGGFPCQDISVAGNRKGLAGERSGLWWEFHRILGELRPEWVVIENVAGLLSSNAGRDLGAVVGALGDLGYGWAFRVLDARYFGVAQRRRRVFIVGHLGSRRAAEVLLEPEGVRGDSEAGRSAGQDLAGTLGGGSGTRGWACDTDRMTFVPVSIAENQRGEIRTDSVAQSLTMGGGKPGQGYAAVAIPFVKAKRAQSDTDDETWRGDGPAPTLNAFDNSGESRATVLATTNLAVRRLTPRECERLMGWPDDWTRWTDDGREIADSHRYRMCGNGVVAPVAKWIGRRIVAVTARPGHRAGRPTSVGGPVPETENQ